MNKKFEKWLTIAALGSWVASIGALITLEVSTTQITSDLAVSSASQKLHFYGRKSQFASVLDSQFYQQLKQSDAVLTLKSAQSHWLDHSLVSHEILNRDFSELGVNSQFSSLSSEETLIHSRKPTSVWMLAQIPESWNRSLNK